MPADERLDALGWDIYLLAMARGDSNEHALTLAAGDTEGNTLRVRENVRRDFVARSVRQLEG